MSLGIVEKRTVLSTTNGSAHGGTRVLRTCCCIAKACPGHCLVRAFYAGGLSWEKSRIDWPDNVSHVPATGWFTRLWMTSCLCMCLQSANKKKARSTRLSKSEFDLVSSTTQSAVTSISRVISSLSTESSATGSVIWMRFSVIAISSVSSNRASRTAAARALPSA